MEGRSEAPDGTMEGTPPSPRPATPFPSATLALLRDDAPRREVLLLRRPVTSSFAPDAWVFPGGRVDPDDLLLDHERLAEGPSPLEWARRLSLPDPREAAGYAVAALRETWEETGILLVAEGAAGADRHAARRRMLAEPGRLAEHLDALGVRLATGALRYLDRWITPAWLPRRFDTRFFAATVEPGTRCILEGDELVEFRWIRPAAALDAAARGEMKLLPPTVHTLRSLDDP